MIKKILFILAIVLTASLNAQNISGYIYKDADKNPAQFANIALFGLPDTNFITGVVSYMEGDFTIANVDTGNYLLKISFVGFEENAFPVTVKDQDVQLGEIYLNESSQAIEEVEVKGTMLRGEELVDRTVYTIPPEIEKSSSTGYDVLKKIPSVNVDFNDNVSIIGKSNFIIEIDGKQRDSKFLSRIMPEDIESVEIIHNPSGKYDGTIDAVLSIKLKPEARVGVSGNIGTGFKPFGKKTIQTFGGLDYGLEKVTFYVSGYAFMQNLTNISEIENSFISIDSTIKQNGTGDFSIAAASVNIGSDYYINKKNTLSINYNLKPNDTYNNLVYEGITGNSTNPLYTNSSQTEMDNSSEEHNISLFYKRTFDKPIQELTSENNFYYYSNNENNNFHNELLTLNDVMVDSLTRDEYTASNRNYISSKWNYVHPIGMSMRLETGIQFYYQWLDYQFEATYDTNSYNYNELRNAAYAGITFNKKKIGAQANLRLERSDIEINDSSTNGYFTLLPSVNLQYKISSKHNIKLTYNRRIHRPGITSLNPNLKYSNTDIYSKGNPTLKPELRDRLQLTYSFNFDKNFITSNIYYEFLKDKTSTRTLLETSPQTGEPIIVTQPQNLLTGYETGIGVSGFVKFVRLDARVFTGRYNEFKDDLTTINSQTYTSFSLMNFYFYQLLEEKLTLFAMLNYQGIKYEAQSKTYNPFFYGLGGSYKYNNHSFSAFYMVPFQNELQTGKTITETDQIYSQTINKFDTSYFIMFSYHYSFNKGKAVKKVGKKADIESDTKSEGIGR